MKNKSISDLMLHDHEQIVQNLKHVEKDGHPNIERFLEFEWHLQKHIFIEEKAIFFSFQSKENSTDEQRFQRLSKEHTAIITLIDKIMKESFPKSNINFNKLKKLLASHKKYEENEIYPLLEKRLNEIQKEEIIKKIKDLIKHDE